MTQAWQIDDCGLPAQSSPGPFVLTATGSMTAALLLAFTSTFGVASAVQLPAYQAFVPGVMPKALGDAAASLTSRVSPDCERGYGPSATR